MEGGLKEKLNTTKNKHAANEGLYRVHACRGKKKARIHFHREVGLRTGGWAETWKRWKYQSTGKVLYNPIFGMRAEGNVFF